MDGLVEAPLHLHTTQVVLCETARCQSCHRESSLCRQHACSGWVERRAKLLQGRGLCGRPVPYVQLAVELAVCALVLQEPLQVARQPCAHLSHCIAAVYMARERALCSSALTPAHSAKAKEADNLHTHDSREANALAPPDEALHTVRSYHFKLCSKACREHVGSTKWVCASRALACCGVWQASAGRMSSGGKGAGQRKATAMVNITVQLMGGTRKLSMDVDGDIAVRCPLLWQAYCSCVRETTGSWQLARSAAVQFSTEEEEPTTLLLPELIKHKSQADQG